MRLVKRIEVIIGESHLDHVVKLLDDASVSGYTVIRNVSGKGDRGVRDGDGLTNVFENTYVLIACDQAHVDALLPRLRRILRDFGGVCLISDAHWLLH